MNTQYIIQLALGVLQSLVTIAASVIVTLVVVQRIEKRRQKKHHREFSDRVQKILLDAVRDVNQATDVKEQPGSSQKDHCIASSGPRSEAEQASE